MKSGICTKCKSNEVYTNEGGSGLGVELLTGFSGFSQKFLTVYICCDCGYTEIYFENNREKIKKKWNKVKSL